MAQRTSKAQLAIHGGKPVHEHPWRTGPFHFREEVAAMQKLFSGPALPMARVCAIRIIQHNTIAEARAAGRAVRDVARALLDRGAV